ncbi:hypothetical protein FA15DRAFT_668132 [Coprinopsis marcescibilis]|uniref:MYND-type domain-containing protein n=1 Tax=Coprinopsis marcescibilis TaxID=230819 RepID=A0A5C3KZT9_COPMA|nr:hypothetical protein FA15DRAFT_668132 [Coprinopsis marcescibilis]
MPPLKLSPLAHKHCENCFAIDKDLKAKGRTLMLCAGCKRSHYCDRECQKKHWAEHKSICLHNQYFSEHMKQFATPGSGDHQPEEIEKYLKEWVTFQRDTFAVISISALGLHENPDTLYSHFLFIQLSANFAPAQKRVNKKKAFQVLHAKSTSMDEFAKKWPANVTQMRPFVERGKKNRETGLSDGTVIIFIAVAQALYISHTLAIGLLPIRKFKYDSDWENTLCRLCN